MGGREAYITCHLPSDFWQWFPTWRNPTGSQGTEKPWSIATTGHPPSGWPGVVRSSSPCCCQLCGHRAPAGGPAGSKAAPGRHGPSGLAGLRKPATASALSAEDHEPAACTVGVASSCALPSRSGIQVLFLRPLSFKSVQRGTWLAQLVGQATLELRVVSLSPILGVEVTPK